MKREWTDEHNKKLDGARKAMQQLHRGLWAMNQLTVWDNLHHEDISQCEQCDLAQDYHALVSLYYPTKGPDE